MNQHTHGSYLILGGWSCLPTRLLIPLGWDLCLRNSGHLVLSRCSDNCLLVYQTCAASFIGKTSGRTATVLEEWLRITCISLSLTSCTWTAGISILHVSVLETTQTSHHWHCYESLGHLVRFLRTCFGFKKEANLSLWIPLCGKHTDLPHYPPTQHRLSPICPLFPNPPSVPFWFLLCPCHGQCIFIWS